MKDVCLQDMMTARENRCQRQQMLLECYHVPVVSMTFNIPGPRKVLPSTPAAFLLACSQIEQTLFTHSFPVLHKEMTQAFTGYEICYCVDAPPLLLKQQMMELEDRDAFGRLLDLDVLDLDGAPISRKTLQASPRRCLLCGQPAHVCSRSRHHAVGELVHAINAIMEEAIQAASVISFISKQCENALLAEVSATPKPGLVDRHDSGAHKDMNYDTFVKSTQAIVPYLTQMAQLGYEWSEADGQGLFCAIRPIGIKAEEAMFQATRNVNTHKGMIFSMGLLAASAGLFFRREQQFIAEDILTLGGNLCFDVIEEDFRQMAAREPRTHGEVLYHTMGLKGIRGEAQEGYPSVRKYSLPFLRHLKETGAEDNSAYINTLLALMAHVEDTNVLIRTGEPMLAYEKAQARALLQLGGAQTRAGMEALVRANEDFIVRNISPGGCADLLAITIFLWNLEACWGDSPYDSTSR